MKHSEALVPRGGGGTGGRGDGGSNLLGSLQPFRDASTGYTHRSRRIRSTVSIRALVPPTPAPTAALLWETANKQATTEGGNNNDDERRLLPQGCLETHRSPQRLGGGSGYYRLAPDLAPTTSAEALPPLAFALMNLRTKSVSSFT